MDVVTYERISEADNPDDEHGVDNQRVAGRKLVAERGWTLVGSYTDNDLSATKGKPRPRYLAMMAAAKRREFSAIVVFHTSRLWRNRRERAEGIELLKEAGVSVVAVKGPSLDMTTAAGRGLAELLGAFDTMEVEIKAERQQLANAAAARAGKRWTGCPRPFGYRVEYVPDASKKSGMRRTFVLDDAEAAAIVDAAEALLGGSTIAAVTREWNRRDLRPPQSPENPWRRSSVRKVLRNPRIAGLNVFKGEIVELAEGGKIGWERILDPDIWQAVNNKLDNPGRKAPRGVRTLVGGLARCACGNVATASQNGSREPVYRCQPETQHGRPGPHAALRRAMVDEHVEAVVLERLSRTDAADLITPPATVDTTDLHAEATAIRRNLDELAADRALGLVTRSQMIAATERGNKRLAEITDALAESAASSALAPFATGEAAADVWAALDLARKRAIIGTLMSITLHSAGRRAGKADPFKVVEIAWLKPTE